jgi:beta-N-acetylhexosaminidase
MGKLVDLTAKPYYLNAEQIKWVEETIAGMTVEEKIGQLFICHNHNLDIETAKKDLRKYHYGGQRYKDSGSTAREVYEFLKAAQAESKIPLLVAANCDSGGDGCCGDGTYIASGAAIEASGSEEVAYNVGYVSGREEQALGVNWNFDPCVDILMNWRNTIVNTRCCGTDADTVIKYARQYIKGLQQSNVAVCVKHFPGDGTEERDQHLVLGVNELSPEEWDASFGKVYQTLIDDGLMSIMAGHIALPNYQYKLVPGLKYEDVLPATLAPELINGLLKTQLDFNGLVTTDASHMIGMAAAMPRRDFVPQAIAAGVDMFLFWRDADEDYGYMLDGYRRGVITEERLTDALRRILGVKAALGLHKLQREGKLTPPEEGLAVIGCAEHLAMAEDAADKCISLVKNTRDELPIRPETHRRIELHVLKLEETHGIYKAKAGIEDLIKEELERVGFEVTLADGAQRIGGKVEEFKANFDAVLEFSDVRGYAAENNYRIKWLAPMGADIPWFVSEKPTVFVSLNFTTHLTDVPMVKCYINAYKNTRTVIRAVIQKIMGESDFKGQHFNEHVWCEKWETRR